MRLAPNIYLVASGVQGFSLTDEYDCNCYLFDVGDELILFDSGAGIDVGAILSVMRDDGLDPTKLSHLYLTHGHGDHSGGASRLSRETECRIVCSAKTASLLQDGERALSLDKAISAGVYPPGYVYARPKPDVIFDDETRHSIGSLVITPIATPGHSMDHHSFLVEHDGVAALVTGDAMLHSGRIIYQNTYDFDVQASGESIRRLANYDFDVLLPGHGTFVLREAQRHVAAAIARLDQLKTPIPVEFIAI